MGSTQALLWSMYHRYIWLFTFTIGDYDKANVMFTEAHLKAPNHDLSECIDEEGQVYKIEKYCYSTPSNLIVGVVEEGMNEITF